MDLVTSSEEILNGKLHFLRSVGCNSSKAFRIFSSVISQSFSETMKSTILRLLLNALPYDLRRTCLKNISLLYIINLTELSGSRTAFLS